MLARGRLRTDMLVRHTSTSLRQRTTRKKKRDKKERKRPPRLRILRLRMEKPGSAVHRQPLVSPLHPGAHSRLACGAVSGEDGRTRGMSRPYHLCLQYIGPRPLLLFHLALQQEQDRQDRDHHTPQPHLKLRPQPQTSRPLAHSDRTSTPTPGAGPSSLHAHAGRERIPSTRAPEEGRSWARV